MPEDINTSETIPEEQDVSSAEGEENESEVPTQEEVEKQDLSQLSLEELNTLTKRSFKTKDDALKSIKETFDMVGQRKQDAEKKAQESIDMSNFVTREQYETDIFFKENPDFEQVKGTMLAMAKAQNIPIREVAESDDFKQLFEKVSGYDKLQKSKSVLSTNPKLGSVTDKLTKGRTAVDEARKANIEGNRGAYNRKMNEAKKNAVGAVLENLSQ